MIKIKKQGIYFLPLLLLFGLFVFPSSLEAAIISLDPPQGDYGPGNSFAVDVLLDTLECINTVEADISFPADYMSVKDILIGESVLVLWVDRPDSAAVKKANESGLIHFSGGTPGGYCGRIPGDPGNSNLLVRIIFSIPSLIVSEAERDKLDIKILPSSRVFLNDGLGTEGDLELLGASYKYTNEKIEDRQLWLDKINSDHIAPEPFIVELRQNKNMFDNQYYIIFSTVDKQSGIDYYEVLEIAPDQQLGVSRELSFWEKLFGKKLKSPEWKKAEIPYLLDDQSLKSIIRVKARDKNGNERFVEYIPPESMRPIIQKKDNNIIMIIVSVTAFLLVLIILYILIIKNKRKTYEEEQNN